MPMKVITVGAGIAGLSTFLFLKKYCSPITPLEIIVYESHVPGAKLSLADATFQELSSSSLIVGGGLGLSSNGMRVLRDLGPDVYERVKASGFVVEKFVLKSARGWRLNAAPTSDMRGQPGYPAGEEEFCLSVSRHKVWEGIFEAVGKENVKYKKVVKVKKAVPADGKKAAVVFADGTEDEADLVIGADGVRSEVLRGIFPEENMVKPKYEGLLGVGGFLPGPIPEEIQKEKSMVFSFGKNGFFGYCATQPDQTMWWSTYQAENVPDERKLSPEDIRKQLAERHGSWKDPVIQDLIKRSDVEQIYPVWTIGELPHWGTDGLVVVGDAAHALQPTSGQGASQALEDAKCFSLLLSKFLELSTRESKLTNEDAIKLSIQSFYDIRNPRVRKIAKRTEMVAQKKKDQNIGEEMMVCFMLWLMGKVPAVGKALIGDVNQELYNWDMEGLVDAAVKKHDGRDL